VCECGKPVHIKKHGLCWACYQRKRSRKQIVTGTWAKLNGVAPCKCGEASKQMGMCNTCYSRSLRRAQGRPERIPRMTYAWIHTKLKRERGPARDQTCACGRTAQQWSYTQSDPDERRGVVAGTPMRWGTSMEYYLAECSVCHRARDAAQRAEERALLFELMDAGVVIRFEGALQLRP
jgi:hypothetical protein